LAYFDFGVKHPALECKSKQTFMLCPISKSFVMERRRRKRNNSLRGFAACLLYFIFLALLYFIFHALKQMVREASKSHQDDPAFQHVSTGQTSLRDLH
jgi:hypothetical protein